MTKIDNKELKDIQRDPRTGVFTKLDADDWDTLLFHGVHQMYEADARIIEEGHATGALYVIIGGEVRIEQPNNGDSIEIARMGAGSVFGEMSLLDMKGASANVVADGPVELVRIERSEVEQIVGEDPALGLRFYHSLAVTLSTRLRATNRILRRFG